MDFLYQFVSENLIYALGWTVLHSLWQALIIGVLMAFALFTLKNRSAKMRYEVAAFSQFMVFIAALSTFLIYYDGSLRLESFSQLSAQELAQLAAMAQDGLLTKSMLQSGVEFFNTHIPLVVIVWMLGATFFLVRMLSGLLYVQHLRFNNNQPVTVYWNNKLKQLKSRIRLRQKVKLLESAAASVPMVIGYIKPVILLPLGAINNLNESEVEAILAHELAHIKRNDYLINIMLSVIEVLFYFNPAVWWIAANIRTERENCCDDVAVKLCGSSLTYAKALVSLQEIGKSTPSMAMTFSGPKNQLLHRVKRILNQPQNKSNIMEKMTATLLLLFSVILFSVGANSNYDYAAHLADAQHQQVIAESTAINEQAPKPVEIESLKLSPIPEPVKEVERKRYVNNTDEGRVEIEMEESTIVEISINGRIIPKSTFRNYQHLMDDLIVDLNMVPNQSKLDYARNIFADVPGYQHKKTIRKDKDGQTHIVIQSEGQQDTEIIIEGENKFIVIDGKRYEDGDTAVIVERRTAPRFTHKSEAPLSSPKKQFRTNTSPNNFTWSDRKALQQELADMEAEKKRWENAFSPRWSELERNWKKLEQLNKKLWDKQSQINTPQLKRKQALVLSRIIELTKKRDRLAVAKEQWYTEHYKEKNQIIKKLNQVQSRHTSEKKACNKNKKQSSSCNKTNSLTSSLDETAGLSLELNEDGFLSFNNQIKHQLENELLEDFLITSKDDYSFDLNFRRLKINGRKQHKDIFTKYKALYEELTGIEMTLRSQISIQNREGQSNSNFHSSHFTEKDSINTFSCISNSEGKLFITATDSLNSNYDILLAAVELPEQFIFETQFNFEVEKQFDIQPFKIYLKEK